MWREVWQRLGFGYILLLPTLGVLGCAVHEALEALVFELGPMALDITGRSWESGRLHAVVMRWLIRNPPSIFLLFVLPWWIGAWNLLRPATPVSSHDYWRIIFAVTNSATLSVVFFVWGCATLIRKLYLMSYAGPASPWVTVAGIVLLSFVVLFCMAAFRLRSQKIDAS